MPDQFEHSDMDLERGGHEYQRAKDDGNLAPPARDYKIDGYPVSRQEALDQATIIAGSRVHTLSRARKVLSEDGRELTSRDNL